MPQVDPELDAALRRLRAAFGFVEVLRIVDHEHREDRATDEAAESGQNDD